MTARLYGIPAVVMLALTTVGCEQSRDSQSTAPLPRQQYIRFEYQIAATDPAVILELNLHLQNGEMLVEEASLSEAADWCRYEGSFEPTAAQQHPDLLPTEHTREPILNAFGNPRSLGFNYLVSGYQARTRGPLCGSVESTIQGLDLTSSPGTTSGTWRPGEAVTAIVRPAMSDRHLGKAVEFTNSFEGIRLFFDQAIDTVSPHGFIEGRFGFLAIAADGQTAILARNGEFGLQNQR